MAGSEVSSQSVLSRSSLRSRRTILFGGLAQTILIWVAMGLAVPHVALAQPPDTVSASPGPNVLMIVIDDLNDWVGCLDGHPQVQTPHIDQLAGRGTLMTNAHCQAPLCNPSRTSVMTGLRPSTTGIYGLAPWFRSAEPLKEWTTLPQYFRQHGYRTLVAGKVYHGGYPPEEDRPAEFDEYGPSGGVGPRPPEKLVQTPDPHPLVDWGTFPHRDEDKGDWQVASWAVQRLQQEFDSPFFMAVGFSLPHVPLYATEGWFELYPERTLVLPPVLDEDRMDLPRFASYLHWRLPEPRLTFLQQSGQWPLLVRAYLACTSFVDSQVGRVLEALEASGHAQNTIVVLWSDHGFHLGEKGITGKNSLWERSTRVPLIFAGPGVAAGGVCRQPAELLDVYPTLIELCGLPRRGGLEGHSLAAQLQNPSQARPWPAITTHNAGNHTVRSIAWRLIRYADGSEELYNLRSDPNEWYNLADDPQHEQVRSALRAWLPSQSAPPAPGSQHRILVYQDGQAIWEGEPIDPEAELPE